MAFILTAYRNGQAVGVYTGKAGDAWVSAHASEAFAMGEGEASRKAELFNGRSVLTGLTFAAAQQ